MTHLHSAMKFIYVLVFLVYTLIGSQVPNQQEESPLITSYKDYQAMRANSSFQLDWISLGPTVNSARADIVQVDHTRPGTMYVGFGSGGLWKTSNNGIRWDCVFQDQASLGLGDMELAPSDPNIIYLGTGENLKKPRNFTLPGTGMYKSIDAGKTWQYIGLEDSWSIAEIAIHPTNPDIVMVAVLGHLWSKNKNRGLFQTKDGGQSWKQVLYVDESTGANDIVISASQPEIMYASMWEVYPGITGKNSSVYRTENNGKDWVKISNGLPIGPMMGRIGLSVSYNNPKKVYALVDNRDKPDGERAELYVTNDGGNSWTRTHQQPLAIFSVIGWYFTDVYVNPLNDAEVYCAGVRLAHSIDGGKSFSIIGGEVNRAMPGASRGFHLDQCELWINPTNPNHIAAGNDGGFFVSYDKGLSWFHFNNIPVGEFYDISIDKKNFIIYGGTQDNATVFGPAKEINLSIPDPWKYLWIDPWDGGDGCVTQIDPIDNNIIYYSAQHGAAVRANLKEDKIVNIMPRLPKEIKDTLNFNYVAPYLISAHQPQTLYHGGNYIFKSANRGDKWQVISPNICKSSSLEKKSFASGAIAESPIKKGILYAGTDKGAFWVSQNDGRSWEENDAGIANNYIRSICPSRFSQGRVYIAMTGINYDDLGAYLYASENFGKTWTSISGGLPNEPVNVILEDPRDENILYAGCFRGVYVSIDKGKSWSYLGKNMPAVAIADLEIHEPTMKLVAGTHGRGIYMIDIKPIHNFLNTKLTSENAVLFPVDEIVLPWFHPYSGKPAFETLEKAAITFWLKSDALVKLSVRDQKDIEIWSTPIEAKKGINQFRWDMIIKRENSSLPYFTRYETYIRAGNYNMVLTGGNFAKERSFQVQNRIAPPIR